MNWGAEENLWLLAMLPFVGILVFLSHRVKVNRLIKFMGVTYAEKILASSGKQGVLHRTVVLSLCYACICIAMARPQWGFEVRTVKQQGADIMVVVDVSKSMAAEDIQPSRLQRARREIIDLLGMLKGDRIGLLPFAGVGFVQCPLTLDYTAMELFLDSIAQDMIPVPGSAIGTAIRLAHKSLMDGENKESVGKSIILITDGEDQQSQPIAAAKAAAEDGIRIYTIGIGSIGGAPIPNGSGGFVRDRQGRMVMSRLDEKTLETIASLTGGHHVRSTTGDLDLDMIYSQHIRKDLKQGSIRESQEKVWYERYWIFALAAMLLLLWDFYHERRYATS